MLALGIIVAISFFHNHNAGVNCFKIRANRGIMHIFPLLKVIM